MDRLGIDDAAALLRSMVTGATGRVMVGLTGPPGAGKSTVARQLVDGIPGAVLVPMDGYHLAHTSLERLGRVARKGAPDTFDAAGYVALLHRLRAAGDQTVWAPEFRREIEDAVAGAIEVPPDCPLVLTEGNYLLVDDVPWHEVPKILDAVWYVDVPESLRMDRLTRRHIVFGRDPDAAAAHASGSDQANAEVVQATRGRADAVIETD